LKCDIARYFLSIDHAILLKQLAKVVAVTPPHLAARSLRFALPGALRADPVYFPGDSLLPPAEHSRLPLGNQTSQFCQRISIPDHFVLRRLRPMLRPLR
jgi:hypothetical protein